MKDYGVKLSIPINSLILQSKYKACVYYCWSLSYYHHHTPVHSEKKFHIMWYFTFRLHLSSYRFPFEKCFKVFHTFLKKTDRMNHLNNLLSIQISFLPILFILFSLVINLSFSWLLISLLKSHIDVLFQTKLPALAIIFTIIKHTETWVGFS